MSTPQRNSVIRYIRRIASLRIGGGLSDQHLLEQFVTRRDEDAFAALVRRHGAMVMGVCRRVLNDFHGAEDAFQATFLVLAQKAHAIRKPELLPNWLFGVAYRTARRASALEAKRRQREKPWDNETSVAPAEDLIWRDLRPILDEEIYRLPLKYCAPVVLCYFEGKTKEEAARLLGWPLGTVSSRLARAREKLRSRLARRGLAPSAGLLALALTQASASAAIAPSLVSATAAAAGILAGSQAIAVGTCSAKVITLTQGILQAMFLSKIKLATALILAASVLATGAGFVVYRTHTSAFTQTASDDRPTEADLKKEIERLKRELDRVSQEIARLGHEANVVEIPSQREGLISFIGTEIKKGEKVPPERIVTVQIGGKEFKYRRFKVGDTVESGQLLGGVDDELARAEMAIKEKKLVNAKTELTLSERTRDEAKERYATQQRLKQQNATTDEDFRAAKLAWEKYFYEVISKNAAVGVAESELELAQTIVKQHQIRSKVGGVIKAIYKHPGEGVKILEPVFLIRVADDQR
jgi:RNA polymerase sigma factor (sigma-70 family)